VKMIIISRSGTSSQVSNTGCSGKRERRVPGKATPRKTALSQLERAKWVCITLEKDFTPLEVVGSMNPSIFRQLAEPNVLCSPTHFVASTVIHLYIRHPLGAIWPTNG
jgi:hypothetical protein